MANRHILCKVAVSMAVIAKSAPLDVSVVLPFGDDEDVIGTAARRLATYLREQGWSFEILAVDEDCGDNSHAVLSLLRSGHPELRQATAGARGRGLAVGADLARGRAVVVLDPRAAATRPLAALGRAVRRVLRDELDLAAVGSHLAVTHRTRCLGLLETVRGGNGLPRRLARRGRARGLRVEAYELGGDTRRPPRQRSFSRVVAALTPLLGAWR